jgi:hypothetical protein
MEFIFLNSADRQWPTQCIFDLLPLVQDFDIIIASRTNKHYGIIRSFVSWAYDNVPHLIYGIGKHDFGAVKLIRREIIEAFTLVSRSPFTEAERLIRAARAGYRITDYPLDTRPRETGVATGAKPKLIFEAVIDLIRVWRDLK